MAGGLLALEEALERLLAHARRTDVEEISIRDALGRVLDDPLITAGVDVPPFTNSSMDGYAIRAADTPGELPLAGEVAAGPGSPAPLPPGGAVRIMTGAPLPPGADAVVPVERATESDGRVQLGRADAGDHVRHAGSDTPAGTAFCLPGPLTPASIAVLASVGAASVRVRRRPTVTILSSGDELVEAGRRLAPGQIYDANSPSLAAAVVEAGGAASVAARVRDDRDAVRAALQSAAVAADLVVTSGGVSVGRHDHIRQVLEEDGSLDFWRVAVQPGKPLAVGSVGDTVVIGLPGNPVSALVTFELFVRPFVRAQLGLAGDGRQRVRSRPASAMPKDPSRRAFLRVALEREGQALLARWTGGQGSAQLRPLAEADGLLVVPEGEAAADPRRTYETIVTGMLP